MTEIDNKIPQPEPHVHAEVIDDELVLLDSRSDEVVYLNMSAGEIWNCCDGKKTTVQIIDALQRKFQVDQAVIAEDVRNTIEDFYKRGLIVYIAA